MNSNRRTCARNRIQYGMVDFGRHGKANGTVLIHTTPESTFCVHRQRSTQEAWRSWKFLDLREALPAPFHNYVSYICEYEILILFPVYFKISIFCTQLSKTFLSRIRHVKGSNVLNRIRKIKSKTFWFGRLRWKCIRKRYFIHPGEIFTRGKRASWQTMQRSRSYLRISCSLLNSCLSSLTSLRIEGRRLRFRVRLFT